MNGNPADKGKNSFNFSPDIIEQIEALLADADAEDAARVERKKHGEEQDAEIEALFEGLDLADFGKNTQADSKNQEHGGALVEIQERAPAHPALARFEGLATEVAERFVEAREAYFAAHAEHVRDGRPRHESARLLRTRAEYRAARKVISDRVQSTRMRVAAAEDEGWKHELLTAWEAEEVNALRDVEEAAEREKTLKKVSPAPAPRVAAEAKPSRKTLRAGLLAALAPLLAQSTPMVNAPEVPVRAKPIEEPLHPQAESAPDEARRIEISIPATKKGADEMLLQALKEVKAKDERGLVYANLAGGEEVKPKDAMRSLSDALGFLKREAGKERSAIVHEGDRITLDANGDLVYVTSKDEQHLLTKDGKPLVQDWLDYKS